LNASVDITAWETCYFTLCFLCNALVVINVVDSSTGKQVFDTNNT